MRMLVLDGRPERAFTDYKKSLFKLFDTLKIIWIYIGDNVRSYRSEEEGLYALYPDSYAMADLVVYPSGWEGFGNQLLEAFVVGLPAAVFEYPVFKEDIASRGARVVSLGDRLIEDKESRGLVQLPFEVLNRAAQEIMAILTSPEKYKSIVNHNTEVGKRHFSFDTLRAHLRDAVHWASSTG